MPRLQENIRNRIRKLTKPSNAQQAWQPVLEAISNSMMAIEDRFGTEDEASRLAVTQRGRVEVTIENLGTDAVTLEIRDNGVGLDDERFEAFCEVDTEYKRFRGGKGVGRLYWLDAFSKIEVESRYVDFLGEHHTRAFKFVLDDEEQIQFSEPTTSWSNGETGTVVRLGKLRDSPYRAYFPKQAALIANHTASEFIAGFLNGSLPTVDLNIGLKKGKRINVTFPEDIKQYVSYGPLKIEDIQIDGAESFTATAFLCHKKSVRGMDAKHAMHLLGNGRNVETRKLDDLVGLTDIEFEGETELRLQVIVSSMFLDDRTAESRTAFTCPDSEIDGIVKTIMKAVRESELSKIFARWDTDRREAFSEFLSSQPIFAYSDPDTLFNEVIPSSANGPEAFVRALSVLRMRRELDRERKLSELVGNAVSGDEVPEDFASLVANAAAEIQHNEQVALAHHAARRKIVLDLMDRLVRRYRERNSEGADVHHLERTLHTLLVPMRVRGDDPTYLERSSHDLWLLDERLAYAAGFASDLELRKYNVESHLDDRPDLVLWDVGFGLAPIDTAYGDEDVDDLKPLKHVTVVELKHPGRNSYGTSDKLEDQVVKYVRDLSGGKIEGFGRRRIQVANDCQFYCIAVADFTDRLVDNELFAWDTINDGTAYRRSIDRLNTVIEVFSWADVLSTARNRNRALLDAAGLHLRPSTKFEAAKATAP